MCILSLAIGVLLCNHYILHPNLRSAVSPRDSGSLTAKLVGRRMDLPGIKWEDSNLHPVIFVSSTCSYCKASAAFYRRLAYAGKGSHNPVPLLTLSVEPVEAVRRFLASDGIPVNRVVQIAANSYDLQRTPTLLLVDGSGAIQEAIVGMLDPSEEQRVLALVSQGRIRR